MKCLTSQGDYMSFGMTFMELEAIPQDKLVMFVIAFPIQIQKGHLGLASLEVVL